MAKGSCALDEDRQVAEKMFLDVVLREVSMEMGSWHFKMSLGDQTRYHASTWDRGRRRRTFLLRDHTTWRWGLVSFSFSFFSPLTEDVFICFF